MERLKRGAVLRHNPWTRLNWVATPQGALLFTPGSSHFCNREMAELVCNGEALAAASTASLAAELDLLCELFNRGHLVFESL